MERDHQMDDVQAVEQIFSKAARQPPVTGRCRLTRLREHRLSGGRRLPTRRMSPVSRNSKQPPLECQPDRVDLREEDRAAVRQLETPAVDVTRTVRRVSEELRLDTGLGEAGTVE